MRACKHQGRSSVVGAGPVGIEGIGCPGGSFFVRVRSGHKWPRPPPHPPRRLGVPRGRGDNRAPQPQPQPQPQPEAVPQSFSAAR